MIDVGGSGVGRFGVGGLLYKLKNENVFIYIY